MHMIFCNTGFPWIRLGGDCLVQRKFCATSFSCKYEKWRIREHRNHKKSSMLTNFYALYIFRKSSAEGIWKYEVIASIIFINMDILACSWSNQLIIICDKSGKGIRKFNILNNWVSNGRINIFHEFAWLLTTKSRSKDKFPICSYINVFCIISRINLVKLGKGYSIIFIHFEEWFISWEG